MHIPTLIEYATRLGVQAAELHDLVVEAKKSDSTEIRFGSVLMNREGIPIGKGYNRIAKTEEETAWADPNGIIHSEMDAMLNAKTQGHDLNGPRRIPPPANAQ